jgi:LPXTG-motif cell wall-anchored protein
MAIKLDGVTCKNNDSVSNLLKLAGNEFFNGGCAKFEGKKLCYLETRDWARKKIVNTLLGHCRESSADMVFMFLAAALLLATAGLSFLKRRKGY